MTATDIRTTLTAVAEVTDVPDVDQLAFQGRVGAVRRRRTTTRALTAAAAVGVAASVAFIGVRVVGDDSATELSPAEGGSVAVEALPDVTWFVVDRKLVALDSTGEVHRLDQPAEAVVGYTSETVYATDGQSRLVAYDVRPADAEGSGRIVITKGTTPVTEIQSARLSGDGRYIAWIDLDSGLHRYDVKSGKTDLEAELDESVMLLDVEASGALLEKDGELLLLTGDSEPVTVPAPDGVVAASFAGDIVAVPESDTGTRLYDVSSGRPRLTKTLRGVGSIAPDGNHVAVITGTYDEPGSSVSLWSEGEPLWELTGVEGVPEHVRWADEQSLLVFTRSERGSVVYGCGVFDLRCARLPIEGDVQPYE